MLCIIMYHNKHTFVPPELSHVPSWCLLDTDMPIITLAASMWVALPVDEQLQDGHGNKVTTLVTAESPLH